MRRHCLKVGAGESKFISGIKNANRKDAIYAHCETHLLEFSTADFA